MKKNISLKNILSNPTNIVNLCSDVCLNDIFEYCRVRYEDIKSYRTSRNEALKEANEEALQISTMKNYPWPNAANVKFPMITNAAIDYASRIFPAIWQDGEISKTKFYKDQKDYAAGARLSNYINWLLREKIPGWETSLDKLCAAHPINGLMLKKVFYDPEIDSVRSELVYPQDFYISADSPSIESAECYFHRTTKNKNTIISHLRSGVFAGIKEEELDVETSGETDTKHTEALVRQAEKQPQNFSTVYEIIESFVWIDLDGDGYSEPYIVSFIPKIQKICRIVPRFEQVDVTVDDKERVIRIKPMRFFVPFEFLQSPDGSLYALGLGELLLPINKAVDSTINQLLDAGKLNNMNSGWISKALRLSQGDTAFEPGEWKVVNSYMGKLQENILPLPKTEPSPTTFNLLTTLIDAGMKIAGAQDIRDVQIPSNLSAISSMAIIENGMSGMKSVYKRFHRSLSMELQLILEWVRRYPDVNEYRTVVGDEGNAGDFNLGESVVPVSDPNLITTISKATKAEQLNQMMQTNPAALDPYKTSIKVMDLIGINPTEVIKTETTAADEMAAAKAGEELTLIKSEIAKTLAIALRAKDQGIGDLARANSETISRAAKALNDLSNAAKTKVPVTVDGKVSSVEVSDPKIFQDEIASLGKAVGITFQTPIGSVLGEKLGQSIPEGVQGVEDVAANDTKIIQKQSDQNGFKIS